MKGLPRHILVTGSGGFVGSTLVEKLRALGCSVKALDLRSGDDITDWSRIKNIRGFQAAVHLAGKTHVPTSFNEPRDFFLTNVIGTLNILELTRINKARIIYAGSYVYGNPQYLPIDETHPVNPLNPYAESKLMGEKLCHSFHRDFGLAGVIIRPFNVYGPGQESDFLVPKVIEGFNRGKVVLDDPEPRRDFLFVDDVVEAYVKAARFDSPGMETFNIGCGKSHSVDEVVEMISRLCRKNSAVEYQKRKRKNEVLNTVADIRKAARMLDWRPRTDLEKGLRLTINAMLGKEEGCDEIPG